MKELIKALGRDLTAEELKTIKSKTKPSEPFVRVSFGYSCTMVIPLSAMSHVEALMGVALFRERQSYNHYWLTPEAPHDVFDMNIMSAEEVAMEVGYAVFDIKEKPEE